MRHVADTVAGARLVLLDQCGHGAPNSDPDTFCRLLVEPLLAAVGEPYA